jgi:hypothetical protein
MSIKPAADSESLSPVSIRTICGRRESEAEMTVTRKALGALAIGATAFGACAIGALAIGRLAIGQTAMRRVSIADLEVGHLAVDQLTVGGVPITAGDLGIDEPPPIER